MNISASATTQREADRRTDGRFGFKTHDDNDSVILVRGAPTHTQDVIESVAKEMVDKDAQQTLTPQQVEQINAGGAKDVESAVRGQWDELLTDEGHNDASSLHLESGEAAERLKDAAGDYEPFASRVRGTAGVDHPIKHAQIQELVEARRHLNLPKRLESAGNHYLHPESMAFFNARLHSTYWATDDRTIMVDSTQFDEDSARRYRVTELAFDSTLDHQAPEKVRRTTVASFDTLDEARAHQITTLEALKADPDLTFEPNWD